MPPGGPGPMGAPGPGGGPGIVRTGHCRPGPVSQLGVQACGWRFPRLRDPRAKHPRQVLEVAAASKCTSTGPAVVLVGQVAHGRSSGLTAMSSYGLALQDELVGDVRPALWLLLPSSCSCCSWRARTSPTSSWRVRRAVRGRLPCVPRSALRGGGFPAAADGKPASGIGGIASAACSWASGHFALPRRSCPRT